MKEDLEKAKAENKKWNKEKLDLIAKVKNELLETNDKNELKQELFEDLEESNAKLRQDVEGLEEELINIEEMLELSELECEEVTV